MVLWREAGEDVETADELLTVDGVARPFSVEPVAWEDGPPSHDSFTVRRKQPDESVDEVRSCGSSASSRRWALDTGPR